MKPITNPMHERAAREHARETAEHAHLIREIPVGVTAEGEAEKPKNAKLTEGHQKVVEAVRHKGQFQDGWVSVNVVAQQLRLGNDGARDRIKRLVSKGVLQSKLVKTESGYSVRLYAVRGE